MVSQKYYVMGQSHLSSKGQNTLTSACAASSPFFRPLCSSISLPLPPATPIPHPVPDLGILVDTPWESSWFHRGSRCCSHYCSQPYSLLWFSLPEPTPMGWNPWYYSVLRLYEVAPWTSKEVPIWVPTMGLILLPKKVPAMLPKLLPHGFFTVPGLCFWE